MVNLQLFGDNPSVESAGAGVETSESKAIFEMSNQWYQIIDSRFRVSKKRRPYSWVSAGAGSIMPAAVYSAAG